MTFFSHKINTRRKFPKNVNSNLIICWKMAQRGKCVVCQIVQETQVRSKNTNKLLIGFILFTCKCYVALWINFQFVSS